jgi:putative NAD(P)-binding protein
LLADDHKLRSAAAASGEIPSPDPSQVTLAPGAPAIRGQDDLNWTIVRPGRLTDAPATGTIRLAAPPIPRGPVSRADVAAVITALLDEPGTGSKTLELTGGDSPVAAAVRGIA